MSKVSTYINFPKKTEEAFKFYKSVFKTEFSSNGIVHFADMPGNQKMPFANKHKKLVMRVELPITGGHLLVGTDAPESMGFKISFGNNIYINLEPDTREEAQRLYNELSAGGEAIMPFDDMIWGAYFGSCRDKYGIYWMFNYNKK